MSESTSPNEQELVSVATAANEPEAEVLLQLLRAEGISALAQRTTSNVEWGAGGARYVYVRAGEADRAREVLAAYTPTTDEE
jgi:hypothetical protein